MAMWAVKVWAAGGVGGTFGRVSMYCWVSSAAALVAVSGSQSTPLKRERVATCQ